MQLVCTPSVEIGETAARGGRTEGSHGRGRTDGDSSRVVREMRKVAGREKGGAERTTTAAG